MTSGTQSEFREAAKHEHELNERQREILHLIEKGHTNREIAEMLGISVDGAKWNVSEILSKLGLASREEAGEYWAWRHGGVWPRVRALLGAPLARVAVGIGATVVATGTMIAIAAAFGADSHEGSQSLVAQWVLEGEFYQRREGANWTLEPPENADRGTVRWVYVDETHWLIERRYQTERDGTSSGLLVADGEFVHIYEGGPNWHYKIPFKGLPAGFLKDFAAGGPEFRRIEGSIDDLVEAKQGTVRQPEWHRPDAWRGGSDVVLGFPVDIVESTPSWSNSEFRTSGGISRAWIEPVHMLLLKSTSEGNDGSEQGAAWVTSLRFNAEVTADDLRFEPPRNSCDMGEGSPQRPDTVIPQGVTNVEEWLREQKCGKR